LRDTLPAMSEATFRAGDVRPDDVRNVRFSASPFRAGYDQKAQMPVYGD
jgi:DivIVA domain-containing protein